MKIVTEISESQFLRKGHIFLLVETSIGMKGKQFSKNDLILNSEQMMLWLVETIFWTLLRVIVILPSSGNVFFN